jgi:hypothetical protein
VADFLRNWQVAARLRQTLKKNENSGAEPGVLLLLFLTRLGCFITAEEMFRAPKSRRLPAGNKFIKGCFLAIQLIPGDSI